MFNFESIEEALKSAIDAITMLKEEAQEGKEKLDEIIEACETLEDSI